MLYEILMQNVKHVKALIGLQCTKIIFFATAEGSGVVGPDYRMMLLTRKAASRVCLFHLALPLKILSNGSGYRPRGGYNLG